MNATPNSTTTFPAWQATVRQAQAEMSRRAAEEAARREAQEAERQAKLGRDLTLALDHFGIKIDAPLTDTCELDGFCIQIRPLGYEMWKYRGTEENWVRFELDLYTQRPDSIAADDWRGAVRHVSFNRAINGDWQPEQSAFAEALDYVLHEHERRLMEYDHRQRYLAQQANPPAPTVDQQLAAAIRAIVREELDGRYE